MHSEQSASIEHVDVLIVGAGISGTGAAYYLKTMQPAKTFAIVEARYPAIRSDSDLHTFSYEFKPWQHEGDRQRGRHHGPPRTLAGWWRSNASTPANTSP